MAALPVLEDGVPHPPSEETAIVGLPPGSTGSGTQQVAKFDGATTHVKVYQTDCEIGALFLLPDSELLATFKLLTPLAQVDRCTGLGHT